MNRLIFFSPASILNNAGKLQLWTSLLVQILEETHNQIAEATGTSRILTYLLKHSVSVLVLGCFHG